MMRIKRRAVIHSPPYVSSILMASIAVGRFLTVRNYGEEAATSAALRM
ncbi:hypothetical protein [Lacticaseibacillus zhaodongensis]|nr:hypothetical protein [Lacticaseibacillus zhaodongensis]